VRRCFPRIYNKGLLRSYPCFEAQLWFYPRFCHHCDFTLALWKRSFTLPLLFEQRVTVLNWLGKDNFALAKIPLLFPPHCDFTPVFKKKIGSNIGQLVTYISTQHANIDR
jgi:hypothetical protein